MVLSRFTIVSCEATNINIAIGIGHVFIRHISKIHYTDQYYTGIDIGTGIGNIGTAIGNIGVLVKVSLSQSVS